MDTYIGIDCGGTKTDAALCDRRGRVLHRTLSAAGNPVDIGLDRLAGLLEAVTAELLEQGGVRKREVVAVFAGLSGGAAEDIRGAARDILRSLFPDTPFVACDSDLHSVLNGGLFRADGCAVIAGTGSSCFTRCRGRLHQIGGWGHLFDCQGDGFCIGRDAVCAALRQIDGRGCKTLLLPLLEERLNGPLTERLCGLYEGGKRAVAALAPLVFEADIRGDAQARAILDTNMRHLAELVDCAARDFSGPFSTVVTGGILTGGDRAFELFRSWVRAETCPVRLAVPPVFGAVVSAMILAGIPDEELQKLTFENPI